VPHARVDGGDRIELRAKDTVSALEMNCGDTLQWQQSNGQKWTLVLEKTSADIVERVNPGGIVYRFDCRVKINGQSMTMRRYACSQECFYEPYVVDGVRIWPDIVKDVFDLIPVRYPRKGNLQCVPRKDARFALQDAALRVCPKPTRPWLAEPLGFIDVGRCYNGDDCYLGPYLGQACHVGMDINHGKGSLLFAPIDFDTQAYFDSLAAGDNNNRWRGIRRWANGDVWALQSHHLIELCHAENTPLPAGIRYATTAGVHVGSHEHTHFEFKIGRPRSMPISPAAPDESSIAYPIDFDDESERSRKEPEVLHLDPWIVFWQTFEDQRARHGKLGAAIAPVGPCRTGERVRFVASGAAGEEEQSVKTRCTWAFGDGGWATGCQVQHTFAHPGVYPVALVVDDGDVKAARTHHVTVSGDPITAPVLNLSSDEVTFRRRPSWVTDVYGRAPKSLPHMLTLVARSSRPVPGTKVVRLVNTGDGVLPQMSVAIEQIEQVNWLSLEPRGKDHQQSLHVSVDAADVAVGRHEATVWVACPGAVNSPQGFRVELLVKDTPPASDVTVDDRSENCYATPFFWVGHRFCRCPPERRGFAGFYLSNGGQATPGQFVRFTPDLSRGRYEVTLRAETPHATGSEFDVRVRHARGESIVRVHPTRSRQIGQFDFNEGMDGYVEILAAGSQGLVVADAVHFRRVGP
jgi:hypothetical protein